MDEYDSLSTEFSIYWDDLTPQCQNALFGFLGGENGNYDVIPLVTLTKSDEDETLPNEN